MKIYFIGGISQTFKICRMHYYLFVSIGEKETHKKPLLSFSNHWRCFAILFSPFFQALEKCVRSMWAYICKYLRTRMYTTVLHFICVCVYSNANNVRSWMLTAFLPPNKMFFLYVNGWICIYACSSSWCDRNVTVYSLCFYFRILLPHFYSGYLSKKFIFSEIPFKYFMHIIDIIFQIFHSCFLFSISFSIRFSNWPEMPQKTWK